MEKAYNYYFKHIYELKKLYIEGKNILRYLKDKSGKELNTSEFIELSYDLQAGSYTKFAKQNPEIYLQVATLLKNIISNLPDLTNKCSLLEVGVGEASTFVPTLKALEPKISKAYGFDISWSRIKYARKYLEENDIKTKYKLFVSDLFNIPLADNSIDIVYTCHSIEPNGGREEEALKELYRVAKKYVILIEPDYENASKQGKERMDFHGYIKDIDKHIKNLGYVTLLSQPITVSANKLNPSRITVLGKKQIDYSKETQDIFICPITKKPLHKHKYFLTTEEGLISYPDLDNIPCLLSTNAILTTHLLD